MSGLRELFPFSGVEYMVADANPRRPPYPAFAPCPVGFPRADAERIGSRPRAGFFFRIFLFQDEMPAPVALNPLIEFRRDRTIDPLSRRRLETV